jgi:DNA-binding FadR family transcriptional regulator
MPIEIESESDTENLGAAGRLKAYLADSNLELNSRLPPERTLSRQLGVSRSLLDYISSHTTPRELMETRILIEPGLTRLAASHATNADIRGIEHCIRKTKSAADWRVYEIWDNNLHRTIAAAAHNTCLMALFDTLNAVKRAVVWTRPRDVPLARKLDHQSFSDHDAIFSAIIQRDPARAEAAMRGHLESVRDRLMKAMEPGA